MSQPPDPYQRQYNFTNWNITHPGEPHQGDKIDLELNEVKQALDETQARLAEIQRDDGMIRPEALQESLEYWTQEAADKAAEKTYEDNLASVPDKAAARLNLQIPANFVMVDGSQLPSFGPATPEMPEESDAPGDDSSQPGQQPPIGKWFGPLGSYTARRFRSIAMTGGLYDHASWDRSGPMPNIWDRIDALSTGLSWAGTVGWEGNGSTDVAPGDPLGGIFSQHSNILDISLAPSMRNPLATVRLVVDAIETHTVNQPHIPAPTFVDIPGEGTFLRFVASDGMNYLVPATPEGAP